MQNGTERNGTERNGQTSQASALEAVALAQATPAATLAASRRALGLRAAAVSQARAAGCSTADLAAVTGLAAKTVECMGLHKVVSSGRRISKESERRIHELTDLGMPADRVASMLYLNERTVVAALKRREPRAQ